jgi:hypothetical protein
MKTKLDKKSFVKGFVAGFMDTCEGHNGEYGGYKGFQWNVPNEDETKKLKKVVAKNAEKIFDQL